MLMYLITFTCDISATVFCGSFSARDVQRLRAPRRGRTFDLDNFKAYVDVNDDIWLAKKPDYFECATLKYSVLWCNLAQALKEN